jgi:hypothetical protein
MNIVISELIKREYLQPFGISEGEVEDVVKNPDSKKDLPFPDYPVILYLKKMYRGYYLLIDGRWHDPDLLVAYVFKIFPHTLREVRIDNPLQVLQYFAQQFGRILEIGDQYNTFIYNTRFSIPKVKSKDELMKNIFSIMKIQGLKEGEKAVIDFIMELEEGQSNDYIHIDLAYVINDPLYIQYLNENDPGSVDISKHFD